VIDAWGAVRPHFAERAEVRRAYTTDVEKYDRARPGRVEINVAIQTPP
jgi:hypothetical protein